MKTLLDGLKVKDVMTKNVFTVNLNHTWQDAARKMSAKNIHHLVVVNEKHLPILVMSATDFLKIALSDDKSILHHKIEDIKPHNRLYSVQSNAPAYEVVNQMNNHLIESVVVLDADGKLEGIVTTKDLINSIFFGDQFKE